MHALFVLETHQVTFNVLFALTDPPLGISLPHPAAQRAPSHPLGPGYHISSPRRPVLTISPQTATTKHYVPHCSDHFTLVLNYREIDIYLFVYLFLVYLSY